MRQAVRKIINNEREVVEVPYLVSALIPVFSNDLVVNLI